MIDTHCHLYVQEFQDDFDQMLNRAINAGVKKFYMPAIDSDTTEAMLKVEGRFPGKCFAMIGLHPCSVKENYEDELKNIEARLTTRQFAAIGETGLDFYWDKTFIKEQYISLERQVELALKYKLPVVLHTRNAMDETIYEIKKHKLNNPALSGIFHCFGGSLQQATSIIEAGFYIGIGGVVTYKNSGLADVLENISMDHIVLETDAPYLAPMPNRGKRNESSYLKFVAEKIAGIKKISPEEVADITTRNAEAIFG